MDTAFDKGKQASDRGIRAQNMDSALAMQILKIRRELIDLLQLLKGL